jgi:predicted nucleotidyltransferase
MFDISNMRFHHQLEDLLASPVRVRLLRILTKAPRQGFTGRDLARLCERSPSQTINALQGLETSGVVFREIAGRSHVWRLSTDHVLSGLLTKLFEREAGALDALKSDLERAIQPLPVERAWLFGSIARGEERPTSDVDLLVQVTTRADKESVEDALSGLSARFARKYGNPLSALVMDSTRLRQLPSTGLMVRVLAEGQELEGGG